MADLTNQSIQRVQYVQYYVALLTTKGPPPHITPDSPASLQIPQLHYIYKNCSWFVQPLNNPY